MPLSIQKELIRQIEIPANKIGLVIPKNATPSPTLPPGILSSLEELSPPTNPPTQFSFNFVD